MPKSFPENIAGKTEVVKFEDWNKPKFTAAEMTDNARNGYRIRMQRTRAKYKEVLKYLNISSVEKMMGKATRMNKKQLKALKALFAEVE